MEVWIHYVDILICPALLLNHYDLVITHCDIKMGQYCLGFPLNTWRNNNVVIASKRRHFDVITSKWRRFDVITTSLLRNVSAGLWRVLPRYNRNQWCRQSRQNDVVLTWLRRHYCAMCLLGYGVFFRAITGTSDVVSGILRQSVETI